jgi:hypothetical protein
MSPPLGLGCVGQGIGLVNETDCKEGGQPDLWERVVKWSPLLASGNRIQENSLFRST